jgi:Raf kinase inhibitor-like YbhB/YbcL family protein
MNYGRAVFVLSFLAILPAACLVCTAGESDKKPRSQVKEVKMVTLEIKSKAFASGDTISTKHTCDGEDLSPDLTWNKPPEGTKELVLICDDPDAGGGGWVHWVIYSLPPDSMGLPEGVPKKETTTLGAIQGKNDFGKVGYGGPCPPRGPAHRYFFKLYAVDRLLGLKPRATKWDALKAMEGHVLAQGELMGRYGRRS